MGVRKLVSSASAILLGLIIALPVAAQEKKAEKSEKAKAEKVSGDIGLLDTEKNYMIVVTKEGADWIESYKHKIETAELKVPMAMAAE